MGMYVRLSSVDHVVPRSDEIVQKMVLSPITAFTQTIHIRASSVWVIVESPSKNSAVVIRVRLTDHVTATTDFVVAVIMSMKSRLTVSMYRVLPLISISPQESRLYTCGSPLSLANVDRQQQLKDYSIILCNSVLRVRLWKNRSGAHRFETGVVLFFARNSRKKRDGAVLVKHKKRGEGDFVSISRILSCTLTT